MKTKKSIKQLLTFAVVALMSLSFANAQEVKKEVKVENSKVVWKGYKVTGSHEGLVSIKSGYLNFDEDELVGGALKIDMSSITVTDLEGEYKGKLEGHLKADDFFGVVKHPSASLVFTKVKSSGKNSYKVKGDLTIKGITNSIWFNLSVYGSKATASFKIDRTKFDIKYGSASFFDGLKDKTIYDEFDLVADFQF